MTMEGDEENGRGGGRGRGRGGRKLVGTMKEKIHLEDYVEFFISRNTRAFTVNFLNQIVHMHGFLKIHKVPKSEIVNAMDKLDLVEPWRSTLKQDVTPSIPTLEEVVSDLEALKWQECCVTSLQIINAEKEAPQIAPPAVSEPKHKPRKRKEATTKKRLVQSKGDDSLEKTGNNKRKKKIRKKSRVPMKRTCGSGDGRPEPEHVEAYVPLTSREVPYIQIPESSI